MRRHILILAVLAPLAVAGCMSTPTERGLGGAVAGAVIADATKSDVLTGALIGGAAGVISCGIPGLPRCN
jgi:osmotically inducible lipoprotein OsmB